MITEEHEDLVREVREMLTGGAWGNDESRAPLLCNSEITKHNTEPERGTLIPITDDTEFKVICACVSSQWSQSWTYAYDKLWIPCGNDGITVYLHENYRQSSPERIGEIVLEWIKEYYEEKVEML